MTTKTEQKLAEFFGVSISQLYNSDTSATVPLAGKIGAGAIVYPFEGEEGAMGYVEAPPGLPSKGLIAYEIDGYSMPPFKPGHKVFANAERIGDPKDCIGDMCIVQIKNGARMFKILRKGYEPGTFNLDSLDGAPPIENAILEWAARIEGADFR